MIEANKLAAAIAQCASRRYYYVIIRIMSAVRPVYRVSRTLNTYCEVVIDFRTRVLKRDSTWNALCIRRALLNGVEQQNLIKFPDFALITRSRSPTSLTTDVIARCLNCVLASRTSIHPPISHKSQWVMTNADEEDSCMVPRSANMQTENTQLTHYWICFIWELVGFCVILLKNAFSSLSTYVGT